jgi:hypothetical protein
MMEREIERKAFVNGGESVYGWLSSLWMVINAINRRPIGVNR